MEPYFDLFGSLKNETNEVIFCFFRGMENQKIANPALSVPYEKMAK